VNYGLYLSASSALANIHRQSVYANNLANVQTVGFKPDSVTVRQRLPERLTHPGAIADPQQMLEQLGGGVQLGPTTISNRQGDLSATGNPLDLGIVGEGFLMVGDRSGNPEKTALTRDGRLLMDHDGFLAMSANGMRVLNSAGLPIQLDARTPARIHADGRVEQDERIVGRIALVTTAPGDRLIKAGANLLRIEGKPVAALPQADGRIESGHIESSAVDPIDTMMKMISASRSAQSAIEMMKYHDQLLGQTFNTFGRIA